MTSIDALSRSLVDELRRVGAAGTPQVIDAFRRVPRHLFLPGVDAGTAYSNEAIPVKFDGHRIASSSSQPAMMAIMLDQLDVRPGHRVLEIGTGTGFNTALLATLAGPDGHVVTVDIEADLVARARDHLAGAGIHNVSVVCGDGALGHPAGGPYDRIIATVGLWDIPPGLAAQLAPGGRMLLPISVRGSQLSVAFERDGDHFTSVSVRQCGFMRLRGPNSGPEHKVTVDEQLGVRLLVPEEREVDVAAVWRLLTGPSHDVDTGVSATLAEVHEGLDLWLTLGLRTPVQLVAAGLPELVAGGPVPCMYEWRNPPLRERVTIAEHHDDAILALAREPGEPLDLTDPTRCSVLVKVFGTTAGDRAQELVGQVRAWRDAGRPSVSGVAVRAYPTGTEVSSAPGEVLIRKHHHVLVVSWPA